MNRKRTLFEFSFTANRHHLDRDEREVTDESETEAGEPNSETGADDVETSGSAVKKRKTKVFHQKWTGQWQWLRKEEKGMKCSVCEKHHKSNPFTSADGCVNFRTSTLTRHAGSMDHTDSLRAEALQKDFNQAAATAKMQSVAHAKEGVEAAMKTVFWMAKEDIPIKKYTSMMELLKHQECGKLEKLGSGRNATYMSRSAGEDFQACVAEAIRTDIIEKIKLADMFSILTDESTDISITKQMVLYIRVIDSAFIPHTHFLQNVTIDNPKSDANVLFEAMEKCLTDHGLDLKKVKGFGSDGASVMVGKHNGVATKVKGKSPHCVNIHCMAHRFNLATSQASKHIPYLQEFEKTLSDLYYYFGGSKSGNRKCELEDIQKILNDPKVKVKECHEIRWIAFSEAVFAIYRCWPSLVTYFKRHDKSSKGLRSKLLDYRFVVVLYLLMDILPSVAQMSMVLQKQDIDVAAVKPAFEGLKDKIKLARRRKSHYQEELREKLKTKKAGDVTEVEMKGHQLDFGKKLRTTNKDLEEIRHTFCDTLGKNIDERFPLESVTVSSAFHVFGMRSLSFLSKEAQNKYGEKEIKILVDHYGAEMSKGDVTSPAMVDPVKCVEEWHLAKGIVLDQMYPRDSTRLLLKLLFQFHEDVLPNLLVLANLCLIMPYQTADCERGFSCQNGIKTARRNRMCEEHLNTLMTIKCEGGKLEEYDMSKALLIWKGKKQRRGIP
ncbi:zinc finger protein 862-like [Mizuhopecten yessoensis]|uniref:zinc finger protein 862-like n=1 Tax=Mizuhopecten yessoensis TaxID=6573 RepID=UPI000B45DC96|nr:zinc finger protein 862-like [Mizuhopecten yessoensis]